MADFMKRKINRSTIPQGSTIYFNDGEFLNGLSQETEFGGGVRYRIINSSYLQLRTDQTIQAPDIYFAGNSTQLTTLCMNIKTGLPDIVTEFEIGDSRKTHTLDVAEWKTGGIKKITNVNLQNGNKAEIYFSFGDPDTYIPSGTILLEIISIWAE